MYAALFLLTYFECQPFSWQKNIQNWSHVADHYVPRTKQLTQKHVTFVIQMCKIQRTIKCSLMHWDGKNQRQEQAITSTDTSIKTVRQICSLRWNDCKHYAFVALCTTLYELVSLFMRHLYLQLKYLQFYFNIENFTAKISIRTQLGTRGQLCRSASIFM